MFIVSPPSQNFFLESFGSQQRADLWCDHRHCSPRCCTRPPPSPRSDESTPTSSAAGGRWPVAETFRRRCRRTRGSSARSGQRLTQRQRQWLRQRRQRHQRNASNDKSDLRRLRPRLRPQLTADERVRTRAAAMEAISLSHGALSSKLDGRREREVTTNCETLTHSAAIDTAKEAAASVTGLRVGSVLNDGRREQSEDARAHGAASVSAADSTEQASSAFAEAHFNSIKQLQDARALISTYECARGVAPRQPEASTVGASVMIATGLASSALYKRTLSEASRAAAAST